MQELFNIILYMIDADKTAVSPKIYLHTDRHILHVGEKLNLSSYYPKGNMVSLKYKANYDVIYNSNHNGDLPSYEGIEVDKACERPGQYHHQLSVITHTPRFTRSTSDILLRVEIDYDDGMSASDDVNIHVICMYT